MGRTSTPRRAPIGRTTRVTASRTGRRRRLLVPLRKQNIRIRPSGTTLDPEGTPTVDDHGAAAARMLVPSRTRRSLAILELLALVSIAGGCCNGASCHLCTRTLQQHQLQNHASWQYGDATTRSPRAIRPARSTVAVRRPRQAAGAGWPCCGALLTGRQLQCWRRMCTMPPGGMRRRQ